MSEYHGVGYQVKRFRPYRNGNLNFKISLSAKAILSLDLVYMDSYENVMARLLTFIVVSEGLTEWADY